LPFNVHVRAIKEGPLDERTSEEIERLASMLDGGWEPLANAYADVLALRDRARHPGHRGQTAGARVRGRAG